MVESGLNTSIGFFGGGHIDLRDWLLGYTSMLSWGDLPVGYQGGRFHILELGVYVRLDDLVVITFSGLRRHGGTPPMAPEGQQVAQSAYRFTVPMYCPAAIMDGKTLNVLAALPTGAPFTMRPEMTDPRYEVLLQFSIDYFCLSSLRVYTALRAIVSVV